MGWEASGNMRQKVQVWVVSRAADQRWNALLLHLLPHRGALWQPVTGSVEAGEAVSVAALREAREETGLTFQGAVVPLGLEFEFEHNGTKFHETIFAIEAPPELPAVTLADYEHDAFRWVPLEEVSSQMKFESWKKAAD